MYHTLFVKTYMKDFVTQILVNANRTTSGKVAYQAALDALYAGNAAHTLLVDWREGDDDIIKLVAKSLGSAGAALAPVWADGKLYAEFHGQRTLVPLAFEAGEQDTTLLTLNKVLEGKFALRYIKATDGGDTIGFLVLSTARWTSLEKEFGSKVARHFPRLMKSKPLFREVEGGPLTDEQKEAQRVAEFENRKQSRAIAFALSAFRVHSASDRAALLAQLVLVDGEEPVTDAVCGDLHISYFKCYFGTVVDAWQGQTITHESIANYGLTVQELAALARNNVRKRLRAALTWSTIDTVCHVRSTHGIASATMLISDFWLDLESDLREKQIYAIPNRDLMLSAPNSAEGLQRLRMALATCDYEHPHALSRMLFEIHEGRWRVYESDRK
jgi:hypothetical protein